MGRDRGFGGGEQRWLFPANRVTAKRLVEAGLDIHIRQRCPEPEFGRGAFLSLIGRSEKWKHVAYHWLSVTGFLVTGFLRSLSLAFYNVTGFLRASQSAPPVASTNIGSSGRTRCRRKT